jgi:hypothetical protein
MNPELLICSAKLGNKWGCNELTAYNISMEPQDAPTFFEVDPLPRPHVPADMLDKLEAEDTTNLDAFQTISVMDLAMNMTLLEESAVDDFVVHLFDILGYTNHDLLLCSWKDIELIICRVSMNVKTGVCLLKNHYEIILLVQEDKQQMESGEDAEAQLIAKAITAFQSNNKKCILAGLNPVQHLLIPRIVMIGTAPMFYKIRVMKALADAITYGAFPLLFTVIHFHIPAVPCPHRLLSEDEYYSFSKHNYSGYSTLFVHRTQTVMRSSKTFAHPPFYFLSTPVSLVHVSKHLYCAKLCTGTHSGIHLFASIRHLCSHLLKLSILLRINRHAHLFNLSIFRIYLYIQVPHLFLF